MRCLESHRDGDRRQPIRVLAGLGALGAQQSEHAGLEEIGSRLYDARARLLTDRACGLTKLYNSLTTPEADPAIGELRALHEELDRQVLAAYGWDDLFVPDYAVSSGSQFLSFRTAILTRLFALNASRADLEPSTGRKPLVKAGPPRPRKRAKEQAG